MELDNIYHCTVLYLYSPGGRYFDVYHNNGNEGKFLGQSGNSRESSNEMSDTEAESEVDYSAQANPASSGDAYRQFGSSKPIPPPPSPQSPPNNSVANQRFGTVTTQAEGHNSPWTSTNREFSISDIGFDYLSKSGEN